jgi:hypothetical protein
LHNIYKTGQNEIGGIAMERHYENQHNTSLLFLIAQDAVQAEKELTVRILINQLSR